MTAMLPPADANPTSASSYARLNPATRVLWRTVDSVQLELGRKSVVVEGVDADAVRRLLGVAPAGIDSAGLGRDRVLERAAQELVHAGFLWDDSSPSAAPPPRLAAELAALRTRHGRHAPAVLAARAQARVLVSGAGRIAPALGGLLAAAGVGQVHIAGTGPVRLRTTMPAGLAIGDEGREFEHACVDALRRAAPEVRTSAPTRSEPADLVVITGEGPVEEDVHNLLHGDAQAHLVVRCGGDHLVVGPLVLPGLTSCLHCADLHRLDRDPAWSALAVQLAAASKYPPPSDVTLASLAASVGAMHALSFLDGDEPASVNATIELELPDWQLRRRSWSARVDCPCAAAQ
jgi:hypothetical protein